MLSSILMLMILVNELLQMSSEFLILSSETYLIEKLDYFEEIDLCASYQ